MSRRPLDLDLLSPGCEIWAQRDRKIGLDGREVGGIILQVHDTYDQETGEVIRRYQCFDTQRAGSDPLVLPVLLEADLDPDSFGPPTRRRLSIGVRKLATWISRGQDAKRRQPRLGDLSPEEIRWGRWIGVLSQVLESAR